ncbi:MAG: glycogen/starch/alpha-glucan phosphorylase [Planctomycetota bacterium]|nr:MAG: glycogen/starch/alpha-glucan phosphorylase [Planctomycetota bacterium]
MSPSDAAAADLRARIEEVLRRQMARDPQRGAVSELYEALAHSVRGLLAERWLRTQEAYEQRKARELCYVSMEFHLGRLLRANLLALGAEDDAARALEVFGRALEELEEAEVDPGLGSGGLGRLAACFLDSLATLDLPARGYGLRFDMGLFDQAIRDGRQVEEGRAWAPERGWPWEVVRPEEAVRIGFGGHVEVYAQNGRVHRRWVPAGEVLAVPHDVPVAGYRTSTVGTLRLWGARPSGPSLDFEAFQAGAYRLQHEARAITTFLYPADDTREGKLLRLKQQFLLASATVQDVLRRHLARGGRPEGLAEDFVVQLNDTHPALAIPELMRLLVDDHELEWEPAWDVARAAFAYTNHTLLPEALEVWSLDLLSELLPRHVELIQEIDRRFQDAVRSAFPGEGERLRRMALVEPGNPSTVRMANLCVVGSSRVNGVAALHTQLLREGILRDFCDLWPDLLTNKTNGITPRRWLLQANPRLAALISERIGRGWERDLGRLRALDEFADDPDFQEAFRAVKRANKGDLARRIAREAGVVVDPDSLFDVQIKRFHEYKRQLLLLLWVVDRYLRLRDGELPDVVPRTIIFAGKAAATYHVAKQVIELIHAVAAVVNADGRSAGALRVAFLPNYRVSLAEAIVPAAELSEQISTAGYEASGTGNMKLALNGALTIGTLDGANVEIRDEVGDENLFIFGLEAHEVRELRTSGYDPRALVDADPRLAAVLEAIAGGIFSPNEPRRFASLVEEGLLAWDTFMLLADFGSYREAQERVDERYRDPAAWTRSAVRNTARCGKFSSDRTIREYAREVWRLPAQPLDPAGS